MSNALKGIDAFLGILKGKTNGARLSIEEINEAIAEAGAEAGMGGLTVHPAAGLRYTLDELLASVTPGNLHGEVDFGPPVGREILDRDE
ncbi:hypothetical protein WJ85_13600 [Burkholderia ubonensis]|uniref:AbrB/MazE/SpoVT family DNA-binding domain-containing protein n=1 Tax=Burkholderia ubonensis TaxID=101571 RepID=UPI00075E8656|nr:hypothetical protein [Burkholderia ubonensis]KVP14764.1 hypothetical protein WJ85_13600 [Burkholderia ubonensis]